MKMCLLCGLSLLLARSGFGQLAIVDTTQLAAATASLRQHYTHALRDQSSLYNGPAYVNYVRPGTSGHRFFGSPAMQPATVEYGGTTYRGVALRYDLVRGQLVLPAQSGTAELQLVSERVARFTLGGHAFVQLAADSVAGAPLRPGFYEELLAGPVRVLAAHRKKYSEQLDGGRIVGEITARTEYFMQRGGRYYPVSKEGDVLRQFPKDRAALRSYAKAHHLQFDEAGRGAAIVALVRYQATLGTTPN